MTVLGIDFGLRRIGIAIADEQVRVARPLTHVVVDAMDEARERVVQLAREHAAVRLVVGLPITEGGRQGRLARLARRFAQSLSHDLDVPVTYWDERHTSRLAERSLRQLGVRKRGLRGRIDEAAAALILQGYLDASAAHALDHGAT